MRRSRYWTATVLAFGTALGGCREEETKPSQSVGVGKRDEPAAARLIFPDELRCDDAAVNEFVVKAMNICAARKYDDFRLLWSAREDPMSRSEFEESWNAVKNIHVRALEKAKVPSPEPQESGGPTVVQGSQPASSGLQLVFVIFAEVTLDPAHRAAERQPQRDVVLMLVREHDSWRLAQAPKAMRDWVRKLVKEPSGEAATAKSDIATKRSSDEGNSVPPP